MDLEMWFMRSDSRDQGQVAGYWKTHVPGIFFFLGYNTTSEVCFQSSDIFLVK